MSVECVTEQRLICVYTRALCHGKESSVLISREQNNWNKHMLFASINDLYATMKTSDKLMDSTADGCCYALPYTCKYKNHERSVLWIECIFLFIYLQINKSSKVWYYVLYNSASYSYTYIYTLPIVIILMYKIFRTNIYIFSKMF